MTKDDLKNCINTDLSIFMMNVEQFHQQIEKSGRYILITQFDGIGDAVCISAMIRELHKSYPSHKIIIVCYEAKRTLFEFNPNIYRIITVEDDITIYEDYIERLIDRIFELTKLNIEIGIHPQYNEVNLCGNLVLMLSGCKKRIGYSHKDYERFYHNVVINTGREDKHNDLLLTDVITPPDHIINMVGRYLYILEYLSLPITNTKLELFLKQELYVPKPYIVISLGGSVINKRYPYKDLAEILSLFKDKQYVLIGGNESIEEAEYISSVLPYVINYVGKLSILETASIISKAHLYIGNDTGTSHIAAAFDVPSIITWKEAKDRTPIYTNHLSAYTQFYPWYGVEVKQNWYEESIENSLKMCKGIQPNKAIKPCDRRLSYSGCDIEKQHCIATIDKNEIIEAIRFFI